MNEPDRRMALMTKGEIAGTVLIIAVAILFINFSLWQLRRLEQRRTSNAAIESRIDAAAVPAAEILSDTTGALYRRVEVKGAFDNTRSIVLPGRGHEGTPGVHLVTPLILAGSGTAVLVNRGWVPSPDAASIELDSFPGTATAPVVGLALPFLDRRASVTSRADSTRGGDTFRRVWYHVDEAALRAQFPYPLAPFTVQMLPHDGPRTFPRPLPPPELDEGSHLGYAVQWFSFAVIAIVGWITFIVRRRAERSGAAVVRAPPHPSGP
jgi:surfeit locus 1 family protein